ncbi:MAG: trimeric intracellular cation channel family protein [Bacteroidales bacterium]
MLFIDILDYLGTFAFAVSGFRLANTKRFDWFGAYVIGIVTACGGGTLRDVLLGVSPFWMHNPSYLIITAIAMIATIVLFKHLNKMASPLFIFDTLGLGLFVVVGLEKALFCGFPWWVAIIMGTITGSFGGVLRDILINEVPLIFRKEIYASACLCGGIIYFLVTLITIEAIYAQVICVTAVITTRILAQRYNIGLPVLRGDEE